MSNSPVGRFAYLVVAALLAVTGVLAQEIEGRERGCLLETICGG